MCIISQPGRCVPIFLVGDSSVGKTRLARGLARCLGPCDPVHEGIETHYIRLDAHYEDVDKIVIQDFTRDDLQELFLSSRRAVFVLVANPLEQPVASC
eukprot:m.140048 g.140048  ORF g.140048 m.140048 type:complete len:98 (+) comp10007_c1_seq2:1143-1436(+)